MVIARSAVWSVVLSVACASASVCCGQVGASPVGNLQLAPLGLEGAWSTMVRVDPARSRVQSLQVYPGLLLAQTSFGTVQAIDPELGRTLWAVSVGKPNYPTLPPGANAKFVSVTNGTTLYLLDRASGAILWDQKLGGSPCAGSVVSEDRVYVPLERGIIESYRLERRQGLEGLTDGIPKRYSGSQGATATPIVFGKRVAWTVPEGFVYCSEEAFKLTQFRFRTDDDVSASPVYMPPFLYAASRRGTLYALDAVTGGEIWRMSADSSVSEPLVAVDGALYVVTETGEMLRVNPRNGGQVWQARGIRQFAAAGAGRVYAIDVYGKLSVRDAAAGAILGAVPTYGFDLPCRNTATDRIYLASTTGLVQCLRASQQMQPLHHTAGFAVPPPKKEGEAAAFDASATGELPAAPVAAPDNPFGTNP